MSIADNPQHGKSPRQLEVPTKRVFDPHTRFREVPMTERDRREYRQLVAAANVNLLDWGKGNGSRRMTGQDLRPRYGTASHPLRPTDHQEGTTKGTSPKRRSRPTAAADLGSAQQNGV
jgi:hypothetical protein